MDVMVVDQDSAAIVPREGQNLGLVVLGDDRQASFPSPLQGRACAVIAARVSSALFPGRRGARR